MAITADARRSTGQNVAVIGGEQRAVPGIAALLHDNVDYTAKRATVLGLDARGLNLNFLNEFERNVGLRSATGDVLRVLAFHEVAVF